MTTSAPKMRTVCMLTGDKAPSVFFKALNDADQRVDELERLREENRALKAELDNLRGTYARAIAKGCGRDE